ncbi:MAG TPA: hypothetical protein VEQ41_06000 [Solirubrobacterales bacterium]|nr:hypothetical protein [Solirubrobacterales bacterium]
MKADYDSQGDTIQIELEPADRLGGGSDVVEGGKVIVGFWDGRPVLIDVIGTRDPGFEEPLRVAAARHDLDAEALIAIARAALAAPDRPVQLDVGARLAA